MRTSERERAKERIEKTTEHNKVDTLTLIQYIIITPTCLLVNDFLPSALKNKRKKNEENKIKTILPNTIFSRATSFRVRFQSVPTYQCIVILC